MKKIFRTVLTGLLVTSFALTGATAVSAKTDKEGVSQVIAFGDSFSDNGEANRISKKVVASGNTSAYVKPGDLFWENRYSNSYTAVEVMAQKMNVSLTNYAVGGAKSGYTNFSPWMDTFESTGFLGQVDRHIESVDGEVDADALYFMSIGGNDIPGHINDVKDAADNVVANIETAIRELTANGAEKFLVTGSSDVSISPSRVGNEEAIEIGKLWTSSINTTLPKVLKSLEKELDIQIEYADLEKEARKVVNNPEKYNIKYISEEAQPTWPEELPGCENPDEHLFFDEWHPTGAGHRIFAEVMYKAATKIK